MIFVRSTSSIKKRDLLLMHVLPAVLVFLAMMIIILLNVQSALRQRDIEAEDQAASRAELIERRITDTLTSYEEIAVAGAAFVNGSQSVTRAEFGRFVATFNLDDRNPGYQNMGLSLFVEPGAVDEFIASQRNEYAEFALRPEATDQRRLLPLTYIEPMTEVNRTAIGFDLFSDTARREAVQRAIDSGQVSITRPITLVNDPENRNGFVMYAPVYISQEMPNDTTTRRAAAVGVISEAFIADTFFDAVYESENLVSIALLIAEKDGTELYRSEGFDEIRAQNDSRELRRTLAVQGKEWDVQYVYRDVGLLASVNGEIANTLFGGLLFSTLLATLVFVLLLSRTRSLNHAEEREIQNAKDDLLSLASHQLRTPATSVKQYLGMIKDGYAGDLNEQQATLLKEAYASNERQLGIINEMLYVARADAGRIVLDTAELHLNKLLRDINKDQFPRAKSYQQRLNLIVPKMDVSIEGDAHYLRMAVENVVTNAIKYTPEKGTVTLKLSRTKQNAVITVTDTGVGIPKKDHKLIFGKFSRVPNELSTRTNGTGVGLYLTKQIILLHGGTITFTSEEGNGTTFIITLPLLPQKPDGENKE